ncbi:MAG TPA: oligosaccharide flippase family protein [Candidatus Paceibacterota bacterium]|nr:oligosaccharide flippase family protein [Candidatus Paceibacterota bacterium]
MKDRIIALLRWSERYTQTDMVYLAKGGFWLLLGQIGSVLLGLATAIAFGHFASQDTYGNYKYVLSLAGLFGAFSLSGIGIAVTQAVARGYEGSLAQGFRLSLRWSWGVVLLSAGAATYYYFFARNAFLGASLLVVAFLLPLLNGLSLFSPFLVGKKAFVRDTAYNFLNALFPVAAVIASLFFTHRAVFIILAYFAANAAADALFYLLTLRQAKNAATDPGTFSYSRHLSVMGIVNALADKVDSIAVFSLLGPAQLAVYAFAIAMPEQIKQLVKLVVPLSLPRFAGRSITDIRASLRSKLVYAGMAIFCAFLVYVILAPLLFRVLFPRYIEAVPYSQFYALTLILSFASIILSTVFQAKKRVREQYVISLATGAILLVALPVLTFYDGIGGAIWAQLISRFFNAGISLFYYRRFKEESAPARNVGSP